MNNKKFLFAMGLFIFFALILILASAKPTFAACICGDGYCNTSCENSSNCPSDCGGGGGGGSSCVCGDGYCNTSCETSSNCSSDCPPQCINECSYSGQKRCTGTDTYQTCGNYDSDPCLEWSSTQSCPSDTCIGTTRRTYYCSCSGFCGSACIYTDTSCSTRCYSCGDRTCNSSCGENSSNCAIDCPPACTNECSYSGQTRCHSYAQKQTCGNYDSDPCLEWSLAETCSGSVSCGYGICASDQRPSWHCSNGVCAYNCNYDSSCQQRQNYLLCYDNDVWWHNAQGYRLNKHQECGESSCDSWGSYYCSGNAVYQQKNCYHRGCSNNSCYSTPYTESRLVQVCSSGQICSNGQCINQCECLSGPCCDGCRFKSSSTACDTKIETEYGCPWGTTCGADVGKRTRTSFRYCSGNSASCTGNWGGWMSWTSWLVSDYCSLGETCVAGLSQCSYRAGCTRPTPHYRKDCYNNALYWFDQSGTRGLKYKDCADNNSCTIDSCSNAKCQNELKCDGSACSIGTKDYCKSCNHCGDGICNCEETICSCPADCQTKGLTISFLGKKEKNGAEWKEEFIANPQDMVDLLMIISNNGEEALNNVSIKVDLPKELIYKNNLKIDGASLSGDISSGIVLASLAPKSIKTLTFKGQIVQEKLIDLPKTDIGLIASANVQNLSASDSATIKFGKFASLPTGEANALAALKSMLKGWLIWTAVAIFSVLALFIAGFYFLFWMIKKRKEVERAKYL